MMQSLVGYTDEELRLHVENTEDLYLLADAGKRPELWRELRERFIFTKEQAAVLKEALDDWDTV